MTDDSGGFQLFNLETMSGVFPGVRTQVYQRVRLTPMDPSGGAPCWGQLLWYDDPPACAIHHQTMANGRLEQIPLARLSALPKETLNQRLQEALAAAGWRMETCGSCLHWQANKSTMDEGPLWGLCTLNRPDYDVAQPPELLAVQSHLALRCEHWQPGAGAAETSHNLPIRPLPKAAEISDSKKRGWERVRLQMQRMFAPPPQLPLAERLLERSGAGAGTEPCHVCQGRIANLAALAVESDEGDKETLSVWRCRICHTLYFSDWVDRWERLETLETEESIYRLAPIEAMAFLTVIDNVAGGDHPGLRSQRTAPKEWLKGQVAGWTPLSHIIKQGR